MNESNRDRAREIAKPLLQGDPEEEALFDAGFEEVEGQGVIEEEVLSSPYEELVTRQRLVAEEYGDHSGFLEESSFLNGMAANVLQRRDSRDTARVVASFKAPEISE